MSRRPGPSRAPTTAALPVLATLTALSLAACGSEDAASGGEASEHDDGNITLYTGRNETLVQPILDQFTEDTGVEVDVRYGDTAQMAAQILEEGERTPAEVFLAQDAGALGAVAKGDLLTELPEQTLELVPSTYRDAEGLWVGVTGRSRVLVYNSDMVDEQELPASVFELTEPQWAGKVGIAPTNASFQSFVTAIRVEHGDERAQEYLNALAANEPQIREKNGVIVADVDAGRFPVGLVNHYYVYEKAAEAGADVEDLAVQLHFLPGGGSGALVNISGVALTADQPDGDAQALVDYLLSETGQTYFAEQTFEYPMIDGVGAADGLPPLEELDTPDIDLNDLDDLQTTVRMITEAGLS